MLEKSCCPEYNEFITEDILEITETLFKIAPITNYFQELQYCIEYSVQFYTLKMIMKYSLRTIHGRQLRKGLRWLL